jgi:hypothetical protein
MLKTNKDTTFQTTPNAAITSPINTTNPSATPTMSVPELPITIVLRVLLDTMLAVGLIYCRKKG